MLESNGLGTPNVQNRKTQSRKDLNIIKLIILSNHLTRRWPEVFHTLFPSATYIPTGGIIGDCIRNETCV